MRSLSKIEQKAINATREKLGSEKLPEKPKAELVSKAIDAQDEFVKQDENKLKQALDSQIEKMKMNEQNLSEYQARRVRALAKIMDEVVKEGGQVDSKKDK